jgi:hypothetical protein
MQVQSGLTLSRNAIGSRRDAPRTRAENQLSGAQLSSLGLAEELEHSWMTWATWSFVALGVLARLVRYLVVYPIWHDEAFVAVNFLNRGYLDLLRPLDYYQVCPLLFLWIELTAVRVFGFSELVLRLFPSVCAIASVFLFRHLAARLLRGFPLLLSVAVFATAFYPIRHSAEVKPYASDLSASLILLCLAAEWLRAPDRSRWWWALTLAVPLLLAVSYPSVLVATGLVIGLGRRASFSERRLVRLAFLVYSAVLAMSFLALYFTFTVVQTSAVQSSYREGYWRGSFPPWESPWRIPLWLIEVHTGNTLAYPIGGERGASAGTLAAVLVGVVAFWRRGARVPLFLLLSPFAMGLVAAGLGQYPYGGAPRITQYLAPSICVLAGLGAAVVFSKSASSTWRRRIPGLAVGLLAALGIGLISRDLVQPYRVPGDLTSRSFAHWLWNEYSREMKLVCVKNDLGLTFQPDLWKTGMSAVYLFHQAACAPRDPTESRSILPRSLPREEPLRLVFFDALPRGNPVFEAWLDQIRASCRIRGTREFVVSMGKPNESWLRERYVVLELEPKVALGDRTSGSGLAVHSAGSPAGEHLGGPPVSTPTNLRE